MVRFSTHEYRFDLKDGARWAERLVYFYGKNFEIESVSVPSDLHPKASTTFRDIKMSELSSIIQKMKTADGKMTVHLGRRWVGSAQAAVISSIPYEFAEDAKANSAVEERVKSDATFAKEVEETFKTWKQIVGCYENGHELLVKRSFSKAIDVPTLHMMFRFLLIRQKSPKIEKTFFDSRTNTYHILMHQQIVILDLGGIKMGDDIDFDIDDGFINFPAWTPHFKVWKAKGFPLTPILPPINSPTTTIIIPNTLSTAAKHS